MLWTATPANRARLAEESRRAPPPVPQSNKTEAKPGSPASGGAAERRASVSSVPGQPRCKHPHSETAASPIVEKMEGDVGKPTLSLICPRCGDWFASAMQPDPKTFATIRLKGELERCRSCGRVSRFEKDDYLFR